mgnify:CR=1 FL=1
MQVRALLISRSSQKIPYSFGSLCSSCCGCECQCEQCVETLCRAPSAGSISVGIQRSSDRLIAAPDGRCIARYARRLVFSKGHVRCRDRSLFVNVCSRVSIRARGYCCSHPLMVLPRQSEALREALAFRRSSRQSQRSEAQSGLCEEYLL